MKPRLAHRPWHLVLHPETVARLPLLDGGTLPARPARLWSILPAYPTRCWVFMIGGREGREGIARPYGMLLAVGENSILGVVIPADDVGGFPDGPTKPRPSNSPKRRSGGSYRDEYDRHSRIR